MTKTKRIPVWYRMFMQARLTKLELAVAFIDRADKALEAGFAHYSLACLRKVRLTLK